MRLRLEAAARVRPLPGEAGAGDAAVIRELPDGLLIGMIDVLGHGPEAHEVAVRIAEFLRASPVTDPAALMSGLHERLRGTRGAAAGLCRIDDETGQLTYVAHGNTRARRLWPKPTRLISRDGLIGTAIRQHQPQVLQLETGDVLLFYTDGVGDRFDLDDYRPAISDTPRALAHNVIELFGKAHDDAACIALKVAE